MLTFTGKGLLFTMGLGVVSAWGYAAAALARGITSSTGIALDASAVFTAGVIAGLSGLAAIELCAVCRVYRNVDPVEDIPR